MLYNLNTVSGAKTYLRLILVQNPESASLPQACLTLKTDTETLHLTPDTIATNEFIIPPLVSGRYSYELLIAEHPTLHGVLVVRPSALSGHPAECTADIRIDLPCILVSLTQGPRGLKGERGFSAYEVASQNGYQGSESEWVAELEGAQAAATAAKEQADKAVKQAEAAAGSATTASEQATAAATFADTAGSHADEAAQSATEAKQDADRANAEADRANAAMTEIEYNLLPAAQAAKNYAEEAKTVAQKYAENAGSSATEAGEHASTAADLALAADSSAKEAANFATTASEQATAAANSATAAATAADAVKYDLLPIAVDWLRTQFVQEVGDGNFTITLNEEQKTLNVSFAHDVSEEQCESLLQLCRRVTPQIVGVVREAVPTDYTVLDYLESSGTQNIAVPAPDLETTKERWNVETDMQFLGAPAKIGFSNRGGLSWGLYANNTIGVNDTTSGMQISVAEPFKRYIIGYSTKVYDSRWDITLAVNGEEISPRVGNGAVPPEYKYGIFKTSYESTASNTKPILVWSCKCWCDSVSYDLIPVLDEEGTPCMWDTVSHQKLPNVGTGTFGYRIKGTDVVVKPNATTYSLRAPRDPYYVAPSGVYARLAGENALEILADTEETSGDGWEWFANTADAYEHFGIVPNAEEELLTE